MLPQDLFFFFFNDTATTEIYTLSLHDALPILDRRSRHSRPARTPAAGRRFHALSLRGSGRWVGGRAGTALRGGACRIAVPAEDRKSTRLNSSHANISYAVFCLKKKKLLSPP